MSRCKLRTPSPIHFKLRTVIGIDSLYWFLKKCCFQLYKYCINVPIHVYGAAVGEIKIFHSRVMGKKVFTNIVWMLTTGVSCALGAAVYLLMEKESKFLCFAYFEVMHNFSFSSNFDAVFSLNWLWQGLQVASQWISSISKGFQGNLDCSKKKMVLSCCTQYSPLLINLPKRCYSSNYYIDS
jgi:hypothetical protein